MPRPANRSFGKGNSSPLTASNILRCRTSSGSSALTCGNSTEAPGGRGILRLGVLMGVLEVTSKADKVEVNDADSFLIGLFRVPIFDNLYLKLCIRCKDVRILPDLTPLA